MEELPLMLGIVLMLVAAIGSVLYVALVIAIPVCRMLDWFSGESADVQNASARNTKKIMSLPGRLIGRGRSTRSHNDDDTQT